MSAPNGQTTTPSHAPFDDYQHSQRVAVLVRWFVLGAWLTLLNYRTEPEVSLLVLNGLGTFLVLLNGFAQWRIWVGRPITQRYVMALSITDLVVITVGLSVTSRFENTFFVFYYPALLGASLVFPSRRVSFAIVTLTAAAYLVISLALDPGISFTQREERVLIVRVITMFAVVAAGNLLWRIERMRRIEAVEAEREQARQNLELQKRAQEGELAAERERSRIAREIHDGVAQSLYALSLNLETAAELAQRERAGSLSERLRRLVPLAKKTLLETRHYIHDLKPLLSGERSLDHMVDNQAKEFAMVSGLEVTTSVDGDPVEIPMDKASGLYRILQESLANVLRHADASRVGVRLTFAGEGVRLTVEDDGKGFDPDMDESGYGLANMHERAREMGGELHIEAAPGEGCRLTLIVPVGEASRAAR